MKRMGVLGGISAQATMDFEARVHQVAQRLVPQQWNGGYPPMVVWYHRRLPIRFGDDGRPIVPMEVDPPRCPVLSMIDVAVGEVVCRGWKRVGVLGFNSAPPLYLDPLRQRGIHCETIDARAQAALDAGIRAVMEGREGAVETGHALAAVAALRAAGVDGIILGCTEIPLLVGKDGEAADLINPAALLAEAAVRLALPEPGSIPEIAVARGDAAS
jgi:aspartate/glutamate racemase